MSRNCCIAICPNARASTTRIVTLYRFPICEEQRKKWIDFVGANPTKFRWRYKYLCSDHFTTDPYDPDAVPTIYTLEVVEDEKYITPANIPDEEKEALLVKFVAGVKEGKHEVSPVKEVVEPAIIPEQEEEEPSVKSVQTLEIELLKQEPPTVEEKEIEPAKYVYSWQDFYKPKPKPFTCKYCSRSFTYIKQYRDHVNAHEDIRNYACQYCGKTFVSFSSIAPHERIHTGERPHGCRLCPSKFITKPARDRHERTVHSKKKQVKKKKVDYADLNDQ